MRCGSSKWRWSPWIAIWLFGLAAGFANTNNPARPERGFQYFHERLTQVPWSVHVMKFERNHPDLELHAALGQGTQIGMATVSDQVKQLHPELGKPIAAINGDFYRSSHLYMGDPEGLMISRGELVSAPTPERTCFWIDGAGVPHKGVVTSEFKVTWPGGTATPLGLNEERGSDAAVLYTTAVGKSTRTSDGVDLILQGHEKGLWTPLKVGVTITGRVEKVVAGGNAPLTRDTMVLSLSPKLVKRLPTASPGMLVQISTKTNPDLAGAQMGMGGGPALVTGGKALKLSSAQGRHPRAAVGWNKEHIFLIEVDGRQRNLSLGMSFTELAEHMVKLGCEEALNLDGGGSATFWALGNVVNSPSEGRERPAANSLVLVQKAKTNGQGPVAAAARDRTSAGQ